MDDRLTLIISVFSLLISCAAGFYAWRQARAAEGTLKLEQQLALEQRRPDVQASFTRWEEDFWKTKKFAILNVIYYGDLVLDSLSFEEARGDGQFVLYSDTLGNEITLDELNPIEPAELKFVTDPPEGSRRKMIRLSTVYKRGDDRWTSLIDLPLPDYTENPPTTSAP
jgi:hypothetical protein